MQHGVVGLRDVTRNVTRAEEVRRSVHHVCPRTNGMPRLDAMVPVCWMVRQTAKVEGGSAPAISLGLVWTACVWPNACRLMRCGRDAERQVSGRTRRRLGS